MKLSIGVIFGGRSLEHDLSVLTAIQAMDNIDKERYESTFKAHCMGMPFLLCVSKYVCAGS